MTKTINIIDWTNDGKLAVENSTGKIVNKTNKAADRFSLGKNKKQSKKATL